MYTISRAAEQVGITAATLRAWERRYAVVSPSRTEGAYRVYSADDLRVLHTMKQLVDEGWSAGHAAQEARRRMRPTPAEPIGPTRASAAAGETPTARGAPTGELRDQFVAAAAAHNTRSLDELLDQMYSLQGFETATQQHLFPALTALGDGWAAGRVSVSGEHLASHAVGRRLAAAYDAAGTSGTGPRVLLGLGPGSRHELGLLAFAVAARRQGLRTDYLGADVPVADWLRACADTDVAAVVLSVHGDSDVDAASQVVTEVGRERPDLLIALGGAAQHRAPETAVRLGDDFAAGAHALARAMSSRPSSETSR